jgi:hypothetical protein
MMAYIKALESEQPNEPCNASSIAMHSLRPASRCQNDAFGVSDTFCGSYAAFACPRSRVDVGGDVAVG